MILLTGGTGFLGSALLRRLLLMHPNVHIKLLVRNAQDKGAQERLSALLTGVVGGDNVSRYMDRVSLLPGDLSEDNLGLGRAEFENLANGIRKIFHCGASTSFTLSLADSRNINVKGTVSLAKLADRKPKQISFVHISTAYVAGTREGVVAPGIFGSNFRNAYEQSKAEAERILLDYADSFRDLTIFRPSIIVGDSETGETSSFNVIYTPSRLIVKGLFGVIPGNPSSLLDIVPINYVADAVSIIGMEERAIDAIETFHISAGLGREISVKEIVEALLMAMQNYGRKKIPIPEFIHPDVMCKLQSAISQAAIQGIKNIGRIEKFVESHVPLIRHILPYVHYMIGNPQFDNRSTLARVGDSLGDAPHFLSYSDNVFRYCFETDWGRLPWIDPRGNDFRFRPFAA